MAVFKGSNYVLRAVSFFIPNSSHLSAKLDPGNLIFVGERDGDILFLSIELRLVLYEAHAFHWANQCPKGWIPMGQAGLCTSF